MSLDRIQPLELADPTVLRRAFGAFATGVTVVTVGGGSPHGMTANSFASVSLDPPLLLVCVDRGAAMHQIMSDRGSFGVSVLAADQEPVARHFANRWRPLGSAQFDSVDWRPGRFTDTPLIDGALVRFECELWRTYDGGDHTIFLGNLLSVERSDEQEAALLFLHGRFQRTADERREMTA
jgi:flavin reductase (DIM6/NTAB) family NADH-FMN oxidoreductase RutF